MPSESSERVLVPTSAKVDVRHAKETEDIIARLVEVRCDGQRGQ